MSTRVRVEVLQGFIESLFRSAGLGEEDARLCAGVFLLQEMRGIATHGFRRIKQHLGWLVDGTVNLEPEIKVLRQDSSMSVIDAGNAIGMLGCMAAMRQAVAGARQTGIAQSIVINSNHFLAAAPYCLDAAEQGAIGICFSNSSLAMSYPGTNRAAMSNSPMGFAMPTGAGFPIVFDSALTLSGGKLIQWAQEGVSIPEGLLGLDAEGNITADPQKVLDGGVPQPIGLHKGAGLAILTEVLSGVLGGGDFRHTGTGRGQPDSRRHSYTQTCIAIDIEHFMTLDAFRERMSDYIADLKARPLAPGYDEILLPGERAARSVEACRRDGVPLDDEVEALLLDCSRMLGVPAPFA